MRVELGRVDVSISEIRDLQAGDVLQLACASRCRGLCGGAAEDLAGPGLVGKRRSVQLTRPIVKADESIFMTDVEKTESKEL